MNRREAFNFTKILTLYTYDSEHFSYCKCLEFVSMNYSSYITFYLSDLKKEKQGVMSELKNLDENFISRHLN